MSSSRVTFPEPKFLTPTHSNFKGDMCEAWIAVKIVKNTEVKTPGAVRITAKVAVSSETLDALKKEEEEEKIRRQSDSEPLPSVETQTQT